MKSFSHLPVTNIQIFFSGGVIETKKCQELSVFAIWRNSLSTLKEIYRYYEKNYPQSKENQGLGSTTVTRRILWSKFLDFQQLILTGNAFDIAQVNISFLYKPRLNFEATTQEIKSNGCVISLKFLPCSPAEEYSDMFSKRIVFRRKSLEHGDNLFRRKVSGDIIRIKETFQIRANRLMEINSSVIQVVSPASGLENFFILRENTLTFLFDEQGDLNSSQVFFDELLFIVNESHIADIGEKVISTSFNEVDGGEVGRFATSVFSTKAQIGSKSSQILFLITDCKFLKENTDIRHIHCLNYLEEKRRIDKKRTRRNRLNKNFNFIAFDQLLINGMGNNITPSLKHFKGLTTKNLLSRFIFKEQRECQTQGLLRRFTLEDKKSEFVFARFFASILLTLIKFPEKFLSSLFTINKQVFILMLNLAKSIVQILAIFAFKTQTLPKKALCSTEIWGEKDKQKKAKVYSHSIIESKNTKYSSPLIRKAYFKHLNVSHYNCGWHRIFGSLDDLILLVKPCINCGSAFDRAQNKHAKTDNLKDLHDKKVEQIRYFFGGLSLEVFKKQLSVSKSFILETNLAFLEDVLFRKALQFRSVL